MFEEFIAWAKTHDWRITTARQDVGALPEDVAARYDMPGEYCGFLAQVAGCANAEETKWFLCLDDYRPKPEGDFRWDEFERISLEAAAGDDEWAHSIRAFWDTHCPFFMAVDGLYAYYAFDMRDGSVVSGNEPEFEDIKTVAKSFSDFLSKVVLGKIVL
jgi:hypothetical protein